MIRSGVSRADLIRCHDAMEVAQFQRVAERLGYREEEARESQTERTELTTTQSTQWATNTQQPETQPGGPLHRPYRLVERRMLAPPVEVETSKSAAIPEEPPVAPLPPAPPLVPWSRLWPFLRAALGEKAERGRIDLPALVTALGKGRPPRRLPRLRARRWAPQGQLILDLHARLYPFWDDFNALKDRIPRLRGAAGLDIWRLDHGPGGLGQRWDGDRWGEPEVYLPPTAGTPVLIAGDLDCLGTSDERLGWVRFGRRLAGLGILPVALMPCPPRLWDPALAGLFFPVTLDRAGHFPPGPNGPRPWPAEAPPEQWPTADEGATTLLSLLSACIGIRPALLRHLRHALPVEQADVGSEAAAWCHPAFRAGDFALVPGDAPRIAALREQFKQHNPVDRQLAWNLIRAQQHDASASVCMEERALHAAMNGTSDAGVEAFLDRVAAVMEQDRAGDGQQADFLAGWVNRRGRRMHPAAWIHSPRSEALWLLANPQAVAEGAPLPDGLSLHRALAAQGVPEQPQSWRLVQRGPDLEIEANPKAADPDWPSGSPIVSFATGRPLLQWRPSDQTGGERSLLLTDGARLPPFEGGYWLRTAESEMRIEPVVRPAWADAIGCDDQGLFLTVWQFGREWRLDWRPGSDSVAGHWSDGGNGLSDSTDPDSSLSLGADDIGLYATLTLDGTTAIQRFRWIEPGRFLMGSPDDEHDQFRDEQQHEVILTQGYWLAETACTQVLWHAVMDENPSNFKGDDRPVENVSWDGAQAFIQRLNRRIPPLGARFPTEAEWEYACRAGTTTPFSFGDDITPEQVNYNGEYPYRGQETGLYRRQTVGVKSLPPNPWGLYEMHGNVWEWCQDWYGDYPAGTAIDPAGPATGEYRVLRGGSWLDNARYCRSAFRARYDPGDRLDLFGFRLALGPELKPEQPARGPEGKGEAGQTAQGATGGSGQRGRSGLARLFDWFGKKQ